MSKKKTEASVPSATATAVKAEKAKATTKTAKTKVVSEKTVAKKATTKKVTPKKAASTTPKVTAEATPLASQSVAPKAKKTSMASTAAATTPQAPITHDEIARLAYSYAEARGFVGGSPEEDWFRAEQELRRIREA